MKTIIFLLIMILLLSVFTSSQENFSNLDIKYYNSNNDCIFNTSCQLPPNNVNFFSNKNSIKEEFVSTTNSPGLNTASNYPNCPQGYAPDNQKRCVQFCRGCKTGICLEGDCMGI